MKPAIKTGAVIGTGGAINIELGWVPTFVQVFQSDGLLTTSAFLTWYVPFTSGGTVQILAGHSIRGVTSRAVANVREVFITAAGNWAAGTAAGWLSLEEGSLVGNFSASEDLVVTNLASGSITTAAGGDATAGATTPANLVHNVAFAAAAAPVLAGNAAISRYEGTAAQYSKGFTIGSTLSVTGQLIRFAAFRENT